MPQPAGSTPFPYTTLFRSPVVETADHERTDRAHRADVVATTLALLQAPFDCFGNADRLRYRKAHGGIDTEDRKSTRLNSSHGYISYAVFCLKKKTANHTAA